jgi:probable addiction module antidote protein
VRTLKRRKRSGTITRNEEKMKRKENYRADLLADLRNSAAYAAQYLSAAKADSNEAFLVALRDVAEAQKGVGKVAKEANVNRENLYRALSRDGNPRIDTLDAVLDVLGLAVIFVAKTRAASTTGSTSTEGNPLGSGITITGATTLTGSKYAATLCTQTEYVKAADWKEVSPALLVKSHEDSLTYIGD